MQAARFFGIRHPIPMTEDHFDNLDTDDSQASKAMSESSSGTEDHSMDGELWLVAAQVMDRIFFCVFLVITLLSVICIFGQVAL